jgi:competence protein ComEC
MMFFISFIFGTALLPLFRFFPLTCVVIFAAASALIARKKRYVFLLIILLGASYALARFSPGVETLDVWNRELTLTGRFLPKSSAPSPGGDVKTFTIDTAFEDESGARIEALNGKDAIVFTDFEADPDEEYELLLKTGKDRSRRNPGGGGQIKLYGSAADVKAAGPAPASVANYFNKQRKRIGEYVLGRFSKDSAALIVSVTTGETSYLGDDLKEAFNVTGLAHILSISGTHFGLFSVVMFGMFVFLIKRLPYGALQRMTIYLTPSQAAALLTIPVMVLYLGISGSSPPAVRSFVMIALFLLGLLLGRKGFWLNSLLFAACLLVLWDPRVLYSISFELSFVAVLFIGFALEKGKDDDGDKQNGGRLFRYARQSVTLTMVASFGTVPLVASYFHYFSLISPLANLVAAPLIGFVLVSLAVVSSFIFLLTGDYLFAPLVSWTADASVALVKFLAKAPFADFRLRAFPPALCIMFYLGFVPYFVFGRGKKWLLLPFSPLLFYAALVAADERALSVTFLDVGQGDSAVVRLPDKRVIVIDTGRTGKETAAFLSYEGIRTIDALVLSHAHPDHSGGTGYLMEKFQPGEIWDNGRIVYPEEMAMKAKRRPLERGDIIDAGDCSITVLHPYREFYTRDGNDYEEENNSSLVLSVKGRKKTFLFAGDTGEEAEQDVSHLSKWLRADVIKVPHHGSRRSAGAEFLSKVSPSVAVISAGRENSFGHPSPDVLERLSGVRVFRTDRDGAVKITETESGLDIKTYNDFALEKADGPAAEWRNVRRLFSRW